ncbi:GNAT family N-acetyltransferase [Marimonas lutisalis]|uniref:GNAT family N-acetyltransferase n=1 Tax=Marimonas lutisalis TaxID=2545756 RepID=UPI0010F903F2|nr:GNAT family N-acetyltransferase [Marimonas lutisalis]
MIPLDPPFRLGRATDASALAQLINLAGEGLPEYLWAEEAGTVEAGWELGRAYQAEKAKDGRVVVADEGDGPIAALMGYSIPEYPDPVPADAPPLYRPMLELEALAPKSWFIESLACFPEHRGRGLGSRLLDIAVTIGRDKDADVISLLVEDNNLGAIRLYERRGFEATEEREIIGNGWQTSATKWVLMILDPRRR